MKKSTVNSPAVAVVNRLAPRVTLDGKFFRLGGEKFYVKGVTYGPFAPQEEGGTFGSREQAVRDLCQIRSLGANVVRVYHVPPGWWLDLVAEHQIKAFIDIPWAHHLCFLDSLEAQNQARQAIREGVTACKGHPAVFAFSIANEIPAEIVRWSGPAKVSQFIDTLVGDAKSIDGEALCTFCSFPPTEFLHPQSIDFLSFNVYLHHRPALESYLARLQMLAENKPLVLAEFGMDSRREGEARKCEFLDWQIETAFRAGLAGAIVFSYTDDWFRGGHQIEDWAFGLTTRERQPKESFAVVQKKYREAPRFSLSRAPKVSVVVASYNGARTLKTCLDALMRLNYPDYEIILVDDGSTDDTPQIAQLYRSLRYVRQANLGLSAARNAGIEAASGEIVAFTDSDCRADEDWLYYLVGDLVQSNFAGIGGPNLLPPEDSDVAAAVMVSPGGPAHVMLTDREAEHIPGCNMVFYKWALRQIGGFDPIFRKAGDDVDVCWRLQKLGCQIGFSPAGFVWHYRRSTVAAYFRQQSGYGEAEALLAKKHPEYFNSLGESIWRGRIYSQAKIGVLTPGSVIYHGIFGAGLFQKLYVPQPALAPMLFTALPYHVFVTIPLLVLSTHFTFLWPVALASMLISLGVCVVAAAQADLPLGKRRFWSRPLVAFLFFFQPIARGWSRYRSAWNERVPPPGAPSSDRDLRPGRTMHPAEQTLSYWSEGTLDRFTFLTDVDARLRALGWQVKLDTGYTDYDLEIAGGDWARLRLTTTTEELGEGRRIFRCRLKPEWSFRSQAFFWFWTAVVVTLVGALARIQPWAWMLPLILPVLALFLNGEKRQAQRIMARVLDQIASEHRLVEIRPASHPKQSAKLFSPAKA